MNVPDFHAYRRDAEKLTPEDVAERDVLASWLPSIVFDAHVHNALESHVGDIAARGLSHMMSTFPWNSLVDSRRVQSLLWGPDVSVRSLRFSKTLPGVDYRSVNKWLSQELRQSSDLFGLFGIQTDIDYTIEALEQDRPSALKMYYFVTDPPGRTIRSVFPDEVLAVCENLAIPIILHLPLPITESIAELQTLRDAFPDLRIVLAHLGMALFLRPGLREAYAQAASLNLWLDTACIEHADVLKLAIDTFGGDRILYGSDEPLNLLRATPYLHPSKGPRVAPRIKYHWSDQDEWREFGSLGQSAVQNHWQQLRAVRLACGDDHGLRDMIFSGNAEALFCVKRADAVERRLLVRPGVQGELLPPDPSSTAPPRPGGYLTRPGRDETAMSAPTTRRSPFDGLSPEQRQDATRRAAEMVDWQGRILGQPTPAIAHKYLPQDRKQS